MTLQLHVDGPRWRAHVRAYAEREPDVVPVVKGNGYGFGFERLLAEPAPGYFGSVAVGTYAEAVAALGSTSAELIVLNPWRPGDASATAAMSSSRLVHTVSRVSDVAPFAALAARAGSRARVAIEVLTSMRRHGVTLDALASVASALRAAGDVVSCSSLALHHPIDRRPGSDPVGETLAAVAAVRALAGDASRSTAAGGSVETGSGDGFGALESVYVSHLRADELAAVRAAIGPSVRVRPRVGTGLWLGDRGSYAARGTVLDVHPLRRGDRYGYRQRRAPADGSLVVVGGGTSQGIAMEAPAAPRGAVARSRTFALAGLTATGLALSPFTWAGRKRWFAEPPHMQVSMLFLPSSVAPPAVGDELDVDVRMTTTQFDTVLVT